MAPASNEQYYQIIELNAARADLMVLFHQPDSIDEPQTYLINSRQDIGNQRNANDLLTYCQEYGECLSSHTSLIASSKEIPLNNDQDYFAHKQAIVEKAKAFGFDISPNIDFKEASNELQSREEAAFYNYIKSDSNTIANPRHRSAKDLISVITVDPLPPGMPKIITNDIHTFIELINPKTGEKQRSLAHLTENKFFSDGSLEVIKTHFTNDTVMIEEKYKKMTTKQFTIGFAIGVGAAAVNLANNTTIKIGDPVFKNGEPRVEDETGDKGNTGNETGEEPDVIIGSAESDMALRTAVTFSVSYGQMKTKLIEFEKKYFFSEPAKVASRTAHSYAPRN